MVYIKLLEIIIIIVINNLNIILFGNSIFSVLLLPSLSKRGFNSPVLILSNKKLVIKYKINKEINLKKNQN
jgi:hypothetical protein